MKCHFTNSSLLDVGIFLSGFSLQTTLQTSCLLCKCTRTNSIIWSLKNKVVFTFPMLGLFMKWLTGQKQWKHISAQQKYVYFAFKSSTNRTGGKNSLNAWLGHNQQTSASFNSGVQVDIFVCLSLCYALIILRFLRLRWQRRQLRAHTDWFTWRGERKRCICCGAILTWRLRLELC